MAANIQTNSNDYGKTIIANEVVAIIAALSASDIPGVFSLSSGLVDDITSTLGMKSSKRGVKVELIDDVATISISIVVDYGVRIPDVANSIRSSVIDAVQGMTGLTVDAVNIYVQGVHLEKAPKEVPAEA